MNERGRPAGIGSAGGDAPWRPAGEERDGDVVASSRRSDADSAAQRGGRGFSVRVLADWRELQALEPSWEELARNALEPSPSAESWMLIPALRHRLPGRSARVVLVFASPTGPDQSQPSLCAVFPIEEQSRYRGLPVRLLRLWNHLYSLSPAPLLRADRARECLQVFFDWIVAEHPAWTLVEFPELRADSAFFAALTDVLRHDARTYMVTDLHFRALFRPKANAETYLGTIGTAHHRKEWRRQERRLSEKAALAYESSCAVQDVQGWLDDFVELEMSGWKGKEGTAFGCSEDHRAWLASVVHEAAKRGRLMTSALRVDGRPAAMRLSFLAPPGSYAFKIAYDENLSKFSPGVLLELENIRRLHSDPSIEWMDSLAAPDHSLINRVWVDRTAIISLLVDPGHWFGRLLLSALPLARTLRQFLSRRARPVDDPSRRNDR